MATMALTEELVQLLVPTSYAATFNTAYVGINQYKTIGINIIVSDASSVNFSAQLQVSNDPTDANSWCNYGTAQTLNADGGWALEATQCGFRAIRVAFTRTGGSATFRVIAQLKS